MTAKKQQKGGVDKDFSLKISKVKIEEVNFKEPSESFKESFVDDLLAVKVSLKFAYDFLGEFLAISIHILYEYQEVDDFGNNPILLDFKGTFEFQVGNFDDLVERRDSDVFVPNSLLEIVTSIAVSSCRGIIIAKTAGAFINKFYLPIINPSDLVKNLGPANSQS